MDIVSDFVDKGGKQMTKIRLSLYCKSGSYKSAEGLPETSLPFDVCFMVGAKTTLQEILDSARIVEKEHGCKT